MEEYYGGKEVKFARSEIIIGYQMVLKVLEELHNHDVDTPFQDHTRKNLKQDIRHYKKTLEKLKGNASKTKILVLREPNGTEIWDEDMTFTCHHIICELPAVAQSKELVALRFIQVSNSSCVPDETGYGTDSAGKKATWFLKGWPPTSVGTTDGCQINVQFLVRNTTNAALIVTETSETQNNQPGSIQAPRSSHKYHLINPKEIQEMILNDVPPTEVYKQTSKALKPKEEEQLPTLWCDTSRSVGYSFCSIGEFGNQIEFVSPPSDSKECILNVTWGYSTHPAGIWVKRPCKGNFIYKLNTTVGQRSFDKEEYNKRLKHLRAHPPTGGLIPGSSQDGTEKILTTVVCDKPSCNIDVLGATSVSVHQISNTDCTNMIGLEKGPPLKINILKEGCRVIVTIVGKSVSTTAPSTKPVLTTPKPASAKPKPDRRIGRD
ncbi:hypothetical protein HZA26_03190 [Candidatus Nomurabacteria bacterium]|nr:hypothetical protein [Candidatus Nomurabacteria bacterium]